METYFQGTGDLTTALLLGWSNVMTWFHIKILSAFLQNFFRLTCLSICYPEISRPAWQGSGTSSVKFAGSCLFIRPSIALVIFLWYFWQWLCSTLIDIETMAQLSWWDGSSSFHLLFFCFFFFKFFPFFRGVHISLCKLFWRGLDNVKNQQLKEGVILDGCLGVKGMGGILWG